MRISVVQMCPGYDKANNIALAGHLIEFGDAGRLFSTTLVFHALGREIARCRKIHLFDITIPDGMGCRETSARGEGHHRDARVETRVTFGHSMICDLSGRMVAEMPDGIGSIRAVIDCTVTAKIRRDMAVLEHRAGRPSTAHLDFDRAKSPERKLAA